LRFLPCSRKLCLLRLNNPFRGIVSFRRISFPRVLFHVIVNRFGVAFELVLVVLVCGKICSTAVVISGTPMCFSFGGVVCPPNDDSRPKSFVLASVKRSRFVGDGGSF